ncbi:hypothetical protein SAY86_002614 [Trapa natans]|uniref:MLO-like protein n=1 Tax=Trapa natans TaxID=22666 RepID=A0AAN7LI44_TRANT|nr:hypothetical protein SAY86_002614 [Trapa natans]
MAGTSRVEASAARSLQETPTWALATVCFFFISVSLFIEHLIHLLCHWLKKGRKTALYEAVEKLKSVLMLLGFMSLTLAMTQRSISRICIPNRVADTLLPCRKQISRKTTKSLGSDMIFADGHMFGRRLSSEGTVPDYCESKGKTSLISQEGLNQLSIFIFVLAVMQIVYCVLTMALGRLKVSPFMWCIVVIFMAVDVHGWEVYLWVSFIPLGMGSQFKSAVMEEQTANAIKQWHAEVRKKRKKQHKHGNGSSTTHDDTQDSSSSTSSRYRGHYHGSSLSSQILKADKTDDTGSSFSYHHRIPSFSEPSRIDNGDDHIGSGHHEIVEAPREADHIVHIVELRETKKWEKS